MSGSITWEHSPLPYVVRLRVAMDEDSVPEVSEFHVTAYSIFEAMMQATLQAGGQVLDGTKIRVEDVRPDPRKRQEIVILNKDGHDPK